MFLLYPLFKNFYHSGCWNLSNAFSESIEIIIWFLFFILLVWYITLIDLQLLNHFCISGMNLTWSWCIFLMYGRIQLANILLRIFHLFSSEILGCKFFLFFALVLYQGNSSLIKWTCMCSFKFLEIIWELFTPLKVFGRVNL